MRIIEITEDKISDLAEHVGKMLKHGGKAMECLEEIQSRGGFGERWDDDERRYDEDYDDSDEMGERGGYPRGGYVNRWGYPGGMGQRRGVRGTGRYSRYR